jgi:itaconate CoA-transferase
VHIFDSLIESLSHQLTISQMLGRVPERAGAAHATIAPNQPYRGRDGRDVVVAVQNGREWQRLCLALGIPEVADDPRFATNTDRVSLGPAFDAVLGGRIAELDSDEPIVRLQHAEPAWARINDLPAVLAHPQFAARNRWIDLATPGGTYRALRSAIDIDGVPPVAGPVAALGEHTDRVFTWLDDLERAAS